MKKTAIFYSFNAKKTATVAKMILNEFDDQSIHSHDPATIEFSDLTRYDNLILGVPTWFDGELPTYWDELVPAIEDMNFKGKRVAIFGNGDQVSYPENFGDAVGIMARLMKSKGATIVGLTQNEDYSFERSKAWHDGKFLGLILDFENQPRKNKPRVKNWVQQLKQEMV